MVEVEDGAVPVTPVVMEAVDEVAEAEAEAVEAEVEEVVEAEVEAVETMEGMTTTTMTKTPHLRP